MPDCFNIASLSPQVSASTLQVSFRRGLASTLQVTFCDVIRLTKQSLQGIAAVYGCTSTLESGSVLHCCCRESSQLCPSRLGEVLGDFVSTGEVHMFPCRYAKPVYHNKLSVCRYLRLPADNVMVSQPVSYEAELVICATYNAHQPMKV